MAGRRVVSVYQGFRLASGQYIKSYGTKKGKGIIKNKAKKIREKAFSYVDNPSGNVITQRVSRARSIQILANRQPTNRRPHIV